MLAFARRLAFEAKSRVALGADRVAAVKHAANDVLEPNALARLQRARGMSLARYAWDSTEFYRAHYAAAGFSRSDLEEDDVFTSLPLVSKAHLREQRSGFIATGIDDTRRLPSSTGGSTGQPLSLFHDAKAPTASLWWRVFGWWGVEPFDNRAGIQRERRTRSTILREWAEWWPTKIMSLDARSMTDESMGEFAAQWNGVGPALLNGYVGGIHEFATYVRRHSLALTPPRAIGVTAAPITPSTRRFIEEVLGAPVFDSYRSAEVPWIAAECSAHDGLHILADDRIVEIVDSGGSLLDNGSEGDVVVTDLNNRVFPLVRYELGDRSALLDGACSCGRTLPRMAPIRGRVTDVIRLPTGQRVTGGLTGIFNDRPDAVAQFQVHQHADLSITLRCVPGSAADALAVIEAAGRALGALVATSVPVTVEIVETIAHDRGKMRVVRSDVPADHDVTNDEGAGDKT